ncbi:MAG: hypothetical protein GAK28_00702 [Luteibacter sp.]|uniref:hypothetical protein n=1 Tax=Luteibacter sp. TaxID=1886636 RepID=UPI00137CD236|nr:hypothetical protein [Luteibacter sp.]KAF1009069.1 MAG: hypothetical protein GAK28_00702 [Luteibacter sp.]
MLLQADLSADELTAVEVIEVTAHDLIVSFGAQLEVTLTFDQLQALYLAVAPWSGRG